MRLRGPALYGCDVTVRMPAVLRHRDFRLLVTGVTVSSFGNAITTIALAFAVLDLGGSATDLGIVMAAFAACEVITTLYGGVLGDRFDRQRLMVSASVASALVELLLVVLLVNHHLSLVALTFLGSVLGVVQALNRPSSSAMTRLTVPEADLTAAVTIRPVLNTLASTIGFAVAGVLVSAIGVGWTIGVDAATFAWSALAFAMIDVEHTPIPSGKSMLADLGDGLREVLRHTWLWLLIGQALLYHLFYGGVQQVLGPIVVGKGISPAAWGESLGFLTAGFFVGSLICLRWRPRRALFAGTACLSWTACFPLAMAYAHHLWPILLGAFVHGVGLYIFTIFWDLSINQNVAEDKLARVYAFDEVGSFVARPIGLLITGPLASAVGTRTWLVAVAVVIGGSSLLALTLPDVRRLERTD